MTDPWHIQQRIDQSVDKIVDSWPKTHHAPKDDNTTRRPAPGSHPPLSIAEVNTRDEAWRTMRSWCQIIMQDRELHLGPRTNNGPDLALFISRHADWLAHTDAARDCSDELHDIARRLSNLAEGNRVKRIEIGPCPESTHDELGIETYPCKGTLWAALRKADELLPQNVTCTTTAEHVWSPGQWASLGRRMGRFHPEGVERMVARMTGHTSESQGTRRRLVG